MKTTARRSGVAVIRKNAKPIQKKKLKKCAFSYFAPEAVRVCVAGTFNDWDLQKNALKKDGSGNWKTELLLPAGRYEYRFVVDGDWRSDQQPVECIPNVFGTWNCVIQIN